MRESVLKWEQAVQCGNVLAAVDGRTRLTPWAPIQAKSVANSQKAVHACMWEPNRHMLSQCCSVIIDSEGGRACLVSGVNRPRGGVELTRAKATSLYLACPLSLHFCTIVYCAECPRSVTSGNPSCTLPRVVWLLGETHETTLQTSRRPAGPCWLLQKKPSSDPVA